MSTNSTIAIEAKDGTIKQIYCHWDGYLKGVGQILKDHYSDHSKVESLIALGNISELKSEIGKEHDFRCPFTYGPKEYSEWKSKYGNMCVAYGRDRGDENQQAKEFDSFLDFTINGMKGEFNYILRADGQWYVSTTNTKFKKLTQSMINKEKD